MSRPIVATKLYIPKLRRGLVARPRLLERLRRGVDSRLTVLSAPAGFGKTTLLAAYSSEADREDGSLAWLCLDPADSEPASFWTYVVAALQAAVPEVGADALELIESSSPIEQMLTTLVNDLAATPRSLWLVLDDYHVVDSHEVRDGMAFLLEHLPAHVHVLISTRADPDLPLPRWRARGELVEIRAADLRFTTEEAAAYLNEVMGLDLTALDVAALEERTEGWIAALQLAAISIQGRDDVKDFIARFTGNHRYVVDYLVEEVLQHQPHPVREFLLHTAVLDQLTGPLCDALTGRADGRDMLLTLERANLFLVALDDRRQWWRYHHLFADVLRARLLSEAPDQVPLMHQRASRWYEERELTEDAVRHALAAQDFDRATYLIERALPALRRSRQDAVLLGWLKALPDHAVRRSPVLSVFHGWMLMVAGDLDSAELRFQDAERALAAGADGSAAPAADTEELRRLPTTIEVYRASFAQARGDAAGTVAHARRALELADPDDHLGRAGAAGFLGLAAWATGEVSTALETFAQVVTSLHAAGNLVDELGSTIVLADMWLAAGRPGMARRLCLSALQLAESRGEPVPRASVDLHVGLGELDCEIGDLDSARRHLDVAAALDERSATTENRHRWYLAMGRIAAVEGDPGTAISFLDQAEQHYVRGYFPDVRPVAAMKARVRIAQGELSEAEAWARDHRVSAQDDADYLGEFDQLSLVRLLLARHRAGADGDPADDALRLLDRLHEAAEISGRGGSLIEIRMLQALAHEARGDRAQARTVLGRAFAQAPEPEGYARLFLDEGAPMTALLQDAQQRGIAADHPRRLLRLGESAEASDQRRSPSAASALSDRELQVLRLLDSDLSGPEIARQLFVSHNTVRTHTKHIFTKLDVTNRRAAVRRARELGLM